MYWTETNEKFKKAFVKRVAEYSVTENAYEFGVTAPTIYAWMKRFKCETIYKNRKRKEKLNLKRGQIPSLKNR